MKLAALLFFALLLFAHQLCSPGQSLTWPLSGFRDGPCAPLGYALFGAVGLVTAIYSVDLKRFSDPIKATDTIGFTLLLFMVAVSPNHWMFHRTMAFIVFGSAYVFFAIQLREHRTLMLIHLCAPVLIAALTGFAVYGIWQKSLISYLVVVSTVHHHLAMRDERRTAAAR
jgi:hypothetical protein